MPAALEQTQNSPKHCHKTRLKLNKSGQSKMSILLWDSRMYKTSKLKML